MNMKRTAAPLLTLLACCIVLRETHAQEQLAWKFKTGEVHRYEFEAITHSALLDKKGKPKSTPQKTTVSQTFSIETRAVNADGSAVLALRFERIKQSTEPLSFWVVNFDTEKISKEDQPMAKLWRSLIGKDLTYRMTPSGHVEEFLYGDSLFKLIKASGVTRDIASERTFDELITNLFPVLPKDAVQKGDRWEFTSMSSNPGTRMFTNQELTLVEFRNELAHASVLPRIEFRHSEASGIRTKIEKQEGEGSLVFDTKAGLVRESRLQLELVSKRENLPNMDPIHITIDQVIKLAD